jgi:predicted membrane channel-forming protein YqfA (hemolysin III family)
MSTEPAEPPFHGKFIPDDPQPLPLVGRIAIGIGVSLAIAVLAMLFLNVLNSWGVWVTLLIVSVFTASALGLWIRDAARHPAAEPDDDQAP